MSFLEILKGIVGIIFFLALMATVAIAITAVIFKITNKLDKKRNRSLTIAFFDFFYHRNFKLDWAFYHCISVI